MQHNINGSDEFVNFCSSFNNKYLVNGWPDSKDEHWKFTRLQKLIPEQNLFKLDKNAFFPESLIEFSKDVLDASSIKFFTSDFFKKNKMTDVIFQNLSHAYKISFPSDFINDNPIIIDIELNESSWCSPVFLIDFGIKSNLNIIINVHLTSTSLFTPLFSLNLLNKSSVNLGLNILNSKNKKLINSGCINLIECNIHNNSEMNMVVSQQGINTARSDINVNLLEEKSQFHFNGVYFGRESHHNDITTSINHISPDCVSNQTVRGILDDKSVGVYQGGIKVFQNAQKTDGQQMSRVLLLSKLAESNTKPALEIFADDVSCSHGATIGELDKNQLFYLLSRGIDENEAKKILINAYLNELIGEINHLDLSDLVEKASNYWLKQNDMYVDS